MRYSKIDLTDKGHYLTLGELLFLDRRRKGRNQDEQAAALGVTRHVYASFERDEAIPDRTPIPGSVRQLRDGLTDSERCVIHRRRSGWTQREVAAAMQMSRLAINKMEKGVWKAARLLSYWTGSE